MYIIFEEFIVLLDFKQPVAQFMKYYNPYPEFKWILNFVYII